MSPGDPHPTHPRWRAARGALAAAALALLAPGAAHAATIGLADQNASAYADGRLRALHLAVARLVVPYDAATSQPQLVAVWLSAVAAAGMQPHVAFDEELRAACASCTIVAGDVLDSGSYIRWRVRAARRPPAHHADVPATGAGATSRFDAGLVRPDASLRPSYAAMVRGIAGQPSAAASAPAPASTVRWSATWSKARPALLLVRVRCRTSGGRCAGRVRLSVRTRRTRASATRTASIATRTYRTRSSQRTATLRVRVSRTLRKRLRASAVRRLRLAVRPSTPAGAANTVTLRLPEPR